MRSASSALALLLLSGCASGTIPVRLCDANAESCGEVTEEVEEVLGQAAHILGRPITVRRSQWGSILVILVDVGDDAHAGRKISLSPDPYDPPQPCMEVVHSTRNPIVLAHEIGHALGLHHPCETTEEKARRFNVPLCADGEFNDRLMFPVTGGTRITESEHATMRRSLRIKEACL